MSERKPAYRIIEDRMEFVWLVIQPNGTALVYSFSKRAEAEALAEELNFAYELGRQSVEKMPAKERTK